MLRPPPKPKKLRIRPTQAMLVKWGAIALGVLWLLGAGYQEFLKPDPMEIVRSAQLKRQLEACDGPFSVRYRCKSELMIESENRMFGKWTWKLGVVFIPLIVISLLYHSVFLRFWDRGEPRRG